MTLAVKVLRLRNALAAFGTQKVGEQIPYLCAAGGWPKLDSDQQYFRHCCVLGAQHILRAMAVT